MEHLKIRIFKTIEDEIKLQEFEQWLYKQSDLLEHMDEDFILELFDFNYNQKGAIREFKRKFIKYFDQEEFTNWKILSNLKTLRDGCQEPERILSDFVDLSYRNYPFLSSLAHNQYKLEDYEYFGGSRDGLLKDIQTEADELLNEIEEWSISVSDAGLKYFEPKTKKINMPKYSVCENTSMTSATKKWWEFWK